MISKEYAIMYNAEESHWWHQGMATITETILRTYYQRGEGLRILDTGCGTGAGISLLSGYGTVTGFDISPHAICFCRKRGFKNTFRASVMDIPFPGESFDLVTSFDVLYFSQILDTIALTEFYRVLVPGGKVIIRVPAFDWLRGVHDIKVSTGHRYTLQELSKKLKKSNFDPEFMSYANTFLFPLVALKRLCERVLPPQEDSDLAINMGWFEKLFKRCLILESRLIMKRSLPFGLSVFGVGQKISDDKSGGSHEKIVKH